MSDTRKCHSCNIEKTLDWFTDDHEPLCESCRLRDLIVNGMTSSAFQCPECNAPLTLKYRLKVSSVMPPALSLKTIDPNYVKGLRPEELEMVRTVEESGLLKIFEEVALAECKTNVSDIRRFFVKWVTSAMDYNAKMPGYSVAWMRKEYKATDIKFLQWQRVIGVIVDGVLRSFIGASLVEASKSMLVVNKQSIEKRSEPSMKDVMQWIRTRNGYVIGRGLLFDELKAKSAGAFDTSGL